MKSSALTVKDYLASLPPERREAMAAVREVVNRNLPSGYRESMDGMIVWSVPLEVYPDTYNGQPLAYAGLASQKQNMAIYLMTVYADPKVDTAFRAAFAKAGKKLNMGKSCVRFRRLEDLHLPAIGIAVGACPMEEYVRRARAVHGSAARAARKASSAKAKPAARKPAAKQTARKRQAAARTAGKKRPGSR